MKNRTENRFGGKVMVFKPETFFHDARGQYVELFNKEAFESQFFKNPSRKTGTLAPQFVTDCVSISRRGVMRGIHGDSQTWKLITCLKGAFYLVVVCNDVFSQDYGKWWSTTLNDTNRLSVLVPPFFGNGHLALEEGTIFHYKQSEYYDRAGQFTLYWDDPELGIDWPMEPVSVSARDRGIE